jgi:TetR/AcrR family acrAB operon transcriptional repressor
MARATKEEALETRNRLLDAAEDVFHRNGFARTTLGDVAQAANVTRGAIYCHFKNKSDLFNAMCERVRLPMEAMVEAGTDERINNPLDYLRITCIFFLQEAVRNPHSRKVFDIMFHKCEFVDASDPAFIRQKEANRQAGERIGHLLANAVAKGHLPPDLDIRVASIAFQTSIEGILNSWLFTPDRFNLEDDAERLVDACIETLRCAPSLRVSSS